MAQTFNVDRKKGGTFSFKLDAQGNYTLQKDGFEGVKTLNLPELKKEATKTTTTPKDTKTASAQTKEAFGDVQPFYYRGGGGDSNEQYIDEYQIKKDKSLDTDISQDPNRFLPMSGPVKEPVQEPVSDKFAQSIGPQKVNIPTEKKQISRVNVDQVLNERAQKEPVSDKFKYARGPQQVNVPVDKTFRTETQKFKERYRPTEIKAAPKKQTLPQTVLKNVTTGLKPLANAVGFVMNPIMGVARMVTGAVSPEQRNLNERNSSALSALGYKTRGELGSNRDPGRIAGNPADNVFAGMNAQSMRGNVFNGARKRVETRSTTGIRRVEAKYGKDSKQAKDFRAKTEEFKGQIEKAQGEKNKQDIKKGPGHYGPAARHSGDGGGGNGGCFLKGTQVIMADGSTKAIDKVDLGDNVAKGGKVFAVGRFLNTELYDYKGIKVSGSHMVNEDGIWMRVRDTKHGKSLGNDLNTVYVFGSENRRILINDILFTDYFEVNEQDQLINSEKDFFNNWKSYGNTIDEHNVNTLNAS
jgi:hypothetical protein